MVAEVARTKASAFALRKAKVVDTKGKAVDLTDVIGNEESDAKRAEVAAEFRAARAEASAARKAAKKPAAKKPASKRK
jgi:trigger factor